MTEIRSNSAGRLAAWILPGIAWLACAAVMVRDAWVSDDAFITMRVIENFLAGYGPNFNVGERVQVYTHPSWMVLLSGIYFIVRHLPGPGFQPLLLYHLSIVVSLALSLSTLAIFWRRLAPGWEAALFALLAFGSSRAFVDYSTSGLENPLSHLLGALFLWVTVRTPGRILPAALIAGLAVLTRQDYLLLFAPALLAAVITAADRRRALRDLVLGLAPVLLWHLFSIIYYGFPFPNTAYAKLNTPLERADLIRIGWVYFQDLWIRDRLAFLAILAGLAAAGLTRRTHARALGAGIVLYLVYVLWIGGDFMSGRFFTLPLVLAVGLLVTTFEVLRPRTFLWAALAAAALGLTLPQPTAAPQSRQAVRDLSAFVYAGQVTDERGYYFERTNWLVPDKFILEKRFRRPDPWAFDPSAYEVRLLNDLGIKGYGAGPSVHVYDLYALSDPLLARIPSNPGETSPGHLARSMPAGYLETLWSGENRLEDAALRQYYDGLKRIVSGDLWSPARWRDIVRMNLGGTDALMQEYLRRASR